MLKKIVIGFLILLLLVVGSLFAIPYFFKDQIKAKILAAINEKVDAKISFGAVDLSLIKNFPQATVNLHDLLIINKAPFEGDTLVSLGELNLEMEVKQLWKKEKEAINIDAISSKNGLINIAFNENGVGNFDIALKDEKEVDTAKSKPLGLKISEYSIENFKFRYADARSKIKMVLDSLNHSGTGDFANDKLDLTTKSTTKVSLNMDKMNYMNQIPLSLDAILGIDLKNSKYTFKDNKAKINDLVLNFHGFIALVEKGQEYDLTFETPSSSFKNFLALVPHAYSSKLNEVKTTGDFTVSGFAKGLQSDTSIPKFNLVIASHNASFKFPNLPKSVQNIVLDTKIINETGIINDTYVNLDKLSFQIDKDIFNAKAQIKNIAENALVDAALKGTINLGNLNKAYPVKVSMPLSGILKADVTSKFDMKSVETSQYQKIMNAGSLSLTGFKYRDDQGKVMNINSVAIQFNPKKLNLQEFKATTGRSDMSVKGVLDNFYGFVFKNQNLKGNFSMTANQIAVSDFMTKGADSGNSSGKNTASKAKKSEAVKIPAFLDCVISAKANTVLYDNLTLKNVSGKMAIRDQKVTLTGVKTNIFDGQIGLDGSVSTKTKVPFFDMKLKMDKVDIQKTCTQLDMMHKIIPIAGAINGKINTTIKLNGNLDSKEMTPLMNSVSGDLFGQLLSTTVNEKNSALLNGLSSNLKFLDLKKLNLNNLKAALTFKDGKVNLKPFELKYQDISVNVGGSHGFDQLMNYNLKLNVPVKYLGPKINELLAKIAPDEASKIKDIPINGLIGGTFQAPKFTTDLKQATTDLTNNLVKMGKQKLVNKGKSELEKIINKNKKPGDTTKTKIPVDRKELEEKAKEEVKGKTKDLLNGWLKKK
jgi:AsmA-like C-terminal region/AsmA family